MSTTQVIVIFVVALLVSAWLLWTPRDGGKR